VLANALSRAHQTLLLQCTDIRALWDFSIPMHCWGEDVLHGLSYSNLAVSLFTDLTFALFIPVPMLWNVNVNRRTRLSLFVALGLGTFACIAAFVKIPSLVNYGNTGDWLWDSRNITIWTIVECNIGIVAANLPTLRPLFKSILGTTIQSRDNSAVALRKDKPTILDEASSGRAFNDTSYELGHTKFDGTQASSTRIYGNNGGAHSSEDSVFGGAEAVPPMVGDEGIRKTTTTSVKYGEATLP